MCHLVFNRRLFAALFLLNFLFAGCDRKNPLSQQEPPTAAVQAEPPLAVAEQPHLPNIPQKACGDALLKDTNSYLVKLYPVFVEYSEKNFELVKQYFCEDAFKKFRDKTGKDAIQVASFTSQGRANQFKEKLTQYFSGADIGTPTSVRRGPNEAIPKESVSKAAKLSSNQFAQLAKVIGTEKDFNRHGVVVLPTDMPSGFKITHFLTLDIWGGYYEIVYKNNHNACFFISGGITEPIGDRPTQYERTLNLLSPALGSVDIGITGTDRASDKSFLGFTQSMNRISIGRNSYLFESPAVSIHEESGGYEKINKCKRIDEKDAIHIVSSLQFLNP